MKLAKNMNVSRWLLVACSNKLINYIVVKNVESKKVIVQMKYVSVSFRPLVIFVFISFLI